MRLIAVSIRRYGLPAVVAAILAGLVIPANILDDSFPIKAPIPYATLISLCVWWFFGRPLHAVGIGDRLAETMAFLMPAVWLLVALASETVAPGLLYPFLFLLLHRRWLPARKLFVLAVLISCAAILLVGWYRFTTGDGGSAAEHALGYWGIKYTQSTRNADAFIPLLSLMLIVSIFAAGRLRLGASIILSTLFLMGFAALCLTYSRGGWVAFAAFLALVSLRWKRAGKYLFIFAVVGMLLVLFINLGSVTTETLPLVSRVSSLFTDSVESSNVERIRLVMYALHVISLNPVLGVGPGNFGCCFGADYLDVIGLNHPENLFLHFAAEYGVISLIGLAALVFRSIKQGMTQLAPTPWLAASMLTAGSVWYLFNSELFSIVTWCLLGIGSAVAASATREEAANGYVPG